MKRMTPSNFDWFLHSMLFYHTRFVLEKQKQKPKGDSNEDEEENEENEV